MNIRNINSLSLFWSTHFKFGNNRDVSLLCKALKRHSTSVQSYIFKLVHFIATLKFYDIRELFRSTPNPSVKTNSHKYDFIPSRTDQPGSEKNASFFTLGIWNFLFYKQQLWKCWKSFKRFLPIHNVQVPWVNLFFQQLSRVITWISAERDGLACFRGLF